MSSSTDTQTATRRVRHAYIGIMPYNPFDHDSYVAGEQPGEYVPPDNAYGLQKQVTREDAHGIFYAAVSLLGLLGGTLTDDDRAELLINVEGRTNVAVPITRRDGDVSGMWLVVWPCDRNGVNTDTGDPIEPRGE